MQIEPLKGDGPGAQAQDGGSVELYRRLPTSCRLRAGGVGKQY